MDKRLLHTVVEHTAGMFPQHIAITHGTRRITYEALHAASLRMAACLTTLGVQKDAIVGIALGSSIEYVVTILGVMRAGGVFMPLDLSGPAERLAYMLKKTVPKVLVVGSQPAQDDWSERLAAWPEPPPLLQVGQDLTITLADGTVYDAGTAPAAPLGTGPGPDDSNYIMYTSGSTGNPKAIVGCHKSLSHFMHWEIQEFGLDHTVKVSQFAPVTFDASLRDIFVPLVTGGMLCIPEAADRQQAASLLKWLHTCGITVLHCVPSLFRLLTRELEQQPHLRDTLTQLKYIAMAGEPLYGRDVARWMDVVGNGTQLVNFYGPSETTLIKTFWRVTERPANLHAILPIGFPIANTAVLVLNGTRLCGIGELGEIYIKTPFRTRGYYDDPALTSTAFVQNPLNPDREDILYRTGDLGRYLPDRCLEFVGRLDSQVKVNGIRIELSEVETAVLACPGVNETVVLAQSNAEGENTLVCYYSLKDQANPQDLRAHLQPRLPESMLPAFYLHLQEFPLNLHGKIDKRALPKPEELLYAQTPYDPPTTDLEHQLCQIWGEILSLTKVGINSPFFDIGGHSLKATRVISHIHRALGIDLSLKEFFEHDTVRKLAGYVQQQDSAALQPIPVRATLPTYDLSPMQKRLWILHHMEDGSAAYNVPALYRQTGSLDLAALRRAFGSLVARHEALRTSMPTVNGEPQQYVLDSATAVEQCHIAEIDLSGTANPEEAARQYAEADACQSFDLGQWPLFRIQLLKLAEHSYALYFNMHHIICDAWSLDVLAREFVALYGAYVAGQDNPLAPLRLQYKDYAAWQRDLLASEAGHKAAAYWQQRFAGDLMPLPLHTDFPRPPLQRYHGKTWQVTLDRAITTALQGLCQRYHTSLFVVLASVLKILLYRYTNHNDIVIGTPVTGRNHADLDQQVGLLVNTLALRDDIAGDDTFSTVIERVQHTTLAAHAHQVYPFDALVSALPVRRDLSRSPLFDVMLVVQEEALPWDTAVLHLEPMPFEVKTSRFDLTFEVVPIVGELQLGINYNTDLFRETTVRRLGSHFTELANSVAEYANLPIRDLALLPMAEQVMLSDFFNRTTRPFPQDKTLLQLFDEQAARTPERLAVVDGSAQLTYRQLQQRAGHVATQLMAVHGVQHEEVVGLMVERSPSWIVGLLGIMMAGGTYLPMDPLSPRERTRFMLQDAACRLLLTETAFLEAARQLPATTVLCLEDVFPGEEGANVSSRSGETRPESLAYVIYTSGSTGAPKGVMIEHRGFVNMITDQIRLFDVTSTDHVLQFASSSFDASLSEIFMTLLSGATLVIASAEIIHNVESFVQYLNEQHVTIATLPPSYLNALARRPLPTLRTLITAGEAPMIDDALFYAKNVTYINAYGPTEVSVCATVHYVEATDQSLRTIPIGTPIANTSIYVLDEASHLVPIGLPGEICVAGVGLARGYLNQPELSREKFIAHPFKPGERLYKTGDWGLWRPDGQLEFLGRRDEQVKVRGYRIELEEIRQTLLRHPAVRDAVVILQDDPATSLAGYVVAQTEINAAALSAFLREYLPAYMVPETFVFLEALPLTPHNKIDRQALPSAASLRPLSAPGMAPRNAIEARLATIWQEVLGQDGGIDDNFFQVGGNSLQAIQLLSKISLACGVKLSARELYLHPTVATLAQVLEKTTSLPFLAPAVAADAHQISAAHQTIERRPLLDLVTSGVLPPVHAAAVIYLPDALADHPTLTPDVIAREWCQEQPVVSRILDSPLGRIGEIMLPLFASDLPADPERLRRLMLQAQVIAGRLGATTVSLTGLLPAATGHGQLLAGAVSPTLSELPALTCGYPVTAAAMVLTIERLLEESHRRLDHERVAFVGLGTLATASLALMLHVLPHPEEIILFDVFNHAEVLQEFPGKLAEHYHFAGSIHVHPPGPGVPSRIYDATCIIATTPVPGLLDSALLRPGTLVAQASGLECISGALTGQRCRTTHDILCTEGDLLQTPAALHSTLYLPQAIEAALHRTVGQELLAHKPFAITGCVLAGLLGARDPHLRSAVAASDPGLCLESHRTLRQLGFQAAGLHQGNHVLAAEDIASFRATYGYA